MHIAIKCGACGTPITVPDNQWIFVTADDRTRMIVFTQGHRRGD
jgi:hypothetical protein